MRLLGLFGRYKGDVPELDREASLAARPVLNPMVKVERDEGDNLILQIPRRDTALVRTVAKVFGMTPYRRVALEQLGTFVVELCDGANTVEQIIEALAREHRLSRREAEVSTTTFLRQLAQRSIISLVIDGEAEPDPAE